jgi:predicted transcriptional regulator
MHSNASACTSALKSRADENFNPVPALTRAPAPAEARAVLLAVRPQFADMMMAGTKTIELRKRFPPQPRGTVVFVYASTPVKAVVGTMLLDQVEPCGVDRMWRELVPSIGATKQYIRDYLDERKQVTLLHLRSPRPFSAPILLRDLRTLVRLEPPQSFRYLGPTAQSDLRRLASM